MNTRTGEANQQNTGLKWLNSPLSIYGDKMDKTMGEIRSHIPDFESRPGLATVAQKSEDAQVNNRLHTIVRKPIQKGDGFIPVGVVSKSYVLVQHSTVFEMAKKAFEKSSIDPSTVKSILRITEYGERMHLSCLLPERYSFDPGDGNKMALRLECFNSVDGSTGFQVHMGWFRFVCSNGLMMGVTRFDFRHRHLGDVGLDDVQYILSDGIKESERDRDNFIKWRKSPIKPNHLNEWLKDNVQKEWGFKAATRLYHITQSGYDVDIAGSYINKTPFDISTVIKNRVPGCPKKIDNLFDLSQALAWLAKDRKDVQEQLSWVGQIPGLLKLLQN
jgi:hypothetical protein